MNKTQTLFDPKITMRGNSLTQKKKHQIGFVTLHMFIFRPVFFSSSKYGIRNDKFSWVHRIGSSNMLFLLGWL